MRTYWVAFIVCGLLLSGCGEKETASQSVPAPPEKKTAVEQIEKTANEVAKQATEMVETGTQLVKDTAADVKQAATEVVAAAAKDATAVAEVTKQKTAEIVDKSKQEIVKVKEQLEQQGTTLLSSLQKSPATSETPASEVENKSSNLAPMAATVASSLLATSKSTPEVQVSETLVIENKNGNVTLPHAQHGKLYGCSACHGDTVPGPFELGKVKAHAMCKDCHKEQGGPVKCSGCHKK